VDGLDRAAVVRRLVALEEAGRLGVEEVELAAGGLGVSSRTVWRWVRQARAGEGLDCRPRGRFVVTDEVRQRLAFWRGNAAAVHRELVEAARNGGPVAPSLSTLQRAVARDVLAGDRAGLAGGERARRAFDVFLQRPRAHRNAVWEADLVEAAVEVDVEGRLLKPWVTWFVDAGTNVVCGLAVTPGPASRESVLAGLRAAITLEEPYGPPGGLPERVRIDRGKDFLSRTVASVLAGFAVKVEDLPAYMPHLKGSVETVNGGFERMFVAGLPRYTKAPRLANGRPVDPDAPALTFEAFVAELLAWVGWWNTENVMSELEGMSPLQAWLGDPTPLTTVPVGDLRLLMLEDDGRERKITTKGVAWRARQYVGAWMTGQVGRSVRVRHMPHHEHEIEVFDATTAAHLGAAVLADRASSEQIAELRGARDERRRRVRADLRAAERARRVRYAATTTAAPPQPLDAVTAEQAATELAELGSQRLGAHLRDASHPVGAGAGTGVAELRSGVPPIPAHWVLPRTAARPAARPAAATKPDDSSSSAGSSSSSGTSAAGPQ
jgi:putative transposase